MNDYLLILPTRIPFVTFSSIWNTRNGSKNIKKVISNIWVSVREQSFTKSSLRRFFHNIDKFSNRQYRQQNCFPIHRFDPPNYVLIKYGPSHTSSVFFFCLIRTCCREKSPTWTSSLRGRASLNHCSQWELFVKMTASRGPTFFVRGRFPISVFSVQANITLRSITKGQLLIKYLSHQIGNIVNTFNWCFVNYTVFVAFSR